MAQEHEDGGAHTGNRSTWIVSNSLVIPLVYIPVLYIANSKAFFDCIFFISRRLEEVDLTIFSIDLESVN